MVNIFGFVLWKRVCGKNNLRWPRESDVRRGSSNNEMLKDLFAELRRNHREKLDQICAQMGCDVIPEFDPEKLVIVGSNIRRKHKVGIWETPEEYLDMGNSGLYKGHYEIMRFIGYEFKADSEDQS